MAKKPVEPEVEEDEEDEAPSLTTKGGTPASPAPPPPPPTETHMAPHPVTGQLVPMAGPAPVAAGPSPVAVATRKVRGAPSLVLPMVNTRASHFYFRRVFAILRSLGKMRH